MSIADFARTLNDLGKKREPFLFLVDYEMDRPVVFRLDEIDSDQILYDINGRTNSRSTVVPRNATTFKKFPIAFSDYRDRYNIVRSHLERGDSYLTNLTVKTRIDLPGSLREIFFLSKARYRLWYDDRFLVFSPETFVQMRHGRIYTYPMKGTIDASLPNAREAILSDAKEMAEHVTIVDLLRNDLSAVSTNVQVTRFRFIDEIRTSDKNLLQVSSEICGHLPAGYEAQIGDLIVALLPAGSVTGAPKRKTLSIIREAEKEPRGYYTGIVGLFDGSRLDSGVMIRFIENEGETLYYRSGGGITILSDAVKEYQEAIDKVYVPLD